ncbi:hypothetical protein Droror1_Dr00016531, partial [Drosera rotundifolia]
LVDSLTWFALRSHLLPLSRFTQSLISSSDLISSSSISSSPLSAPDHHSHCAVYSTTPKLYHRRGASSLSSSLNFVATASLSIHSSSSPEPFVTVSISSSTNVDG